jgi:hypothetical protein
MSGPGFPIKLRKTEGPYGSAGAYDVFLDGREIGQVVKWETKEHKTVHSGRIRTGAYSIHTSWRARKLTSGVSVTNAYESLPTYHYRRVDAVEALRRAA